MIIGIPEVFESTPGEAIQARTDALRKISILQCKKLNINLLKVTFRELGPSDFVHLVKAQISNSLNSNGIKKEVFRD